MNDKKGHKPRYYEDKNHHTYLGFYGRPGYDLESNKSKYGRQGSSNYESF